jgi:hypothetical protein
MGGTSMYREQLGEDFISPCDKKYKNYKLKTHFADFYGKPLCNAINPSKFIQNKNSVTCKRCIKVMVSRGLIKAVLCLKKPLNP